MRLQEELIMQNMSNNIGFARCKIPAGDSIADLQGWDELPFG